MSAALFPLAIQREQASQTDPDLATQQTVDKMQALIAQAANDPAIDWACDLALGPARKQNPNTRFICAAVWMWIKRHVKLVEDNILVRVITGADQDQLDLLIAPSALLRMTPACGDCATFAMLASAMLNCLGVDNQLVAAAVNPEKPTIFSHAYCQVELPEGGRFVMDVSHGKFPGEEVPAWRISRKQVWDVPRSPTAQNADAGLQYDGLHGVTPAPTVRAGGIYGVNPAYTRNPGGQRMRRRRGLGDPVSLDFPAYDPSNPTYTPPDALPPSVPLPTYTAPSVNNTPAWLNFFGNLFKASTPVIQQAMLPTGGYIQTGPGGTTISNAVPGAVPGGIGVGISSGGMSGTTLMLLGGGLLMLMLIGGKH